MKLLVVEDDPLIGPAVKAVLENAGYSVVGPVRDASKAARLGARERPDLALIDVYLAGGQNGLTLARRLWEDNGVPSLLLTGFDHHADAVRDIAIGLLRKPVMPDALLDAVAAAGEILDGLRPTFVPAALELFRAPSELPSEPLSGSSAFPRSVPHRAA